MHLFERECSLQRRHQKVLEEANSPALTPQQRDEIGMVCAKAVGELGYSGAGTIEFLYEDEGAFYFIEMNTRLQVEHPVTEAITGLDLVEWQLRVAAGEALPLRQNEIRATGHAIEARLYAEDPERGFLPSIGRLRRLELPGRRAGVRVDSGVRQGDRVTLDYDPLLAKVIAHARDRDGARVALAAALGQATVLGLASNLGFLRRLLCDDDVAAGRLDTGLIERRQKRLAEAGPEARLRLRAAAFLAAGLAAAAGADARGDPHSPWRAAIDWRLGGPARRVCALRIDGAAVTFEVTWHAVGRLGLVIDGTGPVTVSGAALAEGKVAAVIDGQPIAAPLVARGEVIELALAGDRAVVEPPAPGARAAAPGAAADVVAAPLPGRVVAVAVQDGETVAKGAPLVVLEAMKMEHNLLAPHAGRVVRVCCGPGQLVDEGAALVELAQRPVSA